MIISKITSKAQTTIPLAVRTALHLRKGDQVGYVIEDGRVVLSRVANTPDEDPFATFHEWSSDSDTKAYAGF